MARETLTRLAQADRPGLGRRCTSTPTAATGTIHTSRSSCQFQAEGIRLYAAAYAQWQGPRGPPGGARHPALRARVPEEPRRARSTSARTRTWSPASTRPSTSRWTTRRAGRGIPRVDTHLYARESAWMVQALVALYAVTGEEDLLAEAVGGGRAGSSPIARCRAEASGTTTCPSTAAAPRARTSATRSRPAAPSSRSGPSPATALARALARRGRLHREDLRGRGHARPDLGGASEPLRTAQAPAGRERRGRALGQPALSLHRGRRAPAAGRSSDGLLRAAGRRARGSRRPRSFSRTRSAPRSPAPDGRGLARRRRLARAPRGGGLGSGCLQAGGAAGFARRRPSQSGRGVSAARPTRRIRLRQRALLAPGLHARGAPQADHPASCLRRKPVESVPPPKEEEGFDAEETRLAAAGRSRAGRVRRAARNPGGPRAASRRTRGAQAGDAPPRPRHAPPSDRDRLRRRRRSTSTRAW